MKPPIDADRIVALVLEDDYDFDAKADMQGQMPAIPATISIDGIYRVAGYTIKDIAQLDGRRIGDVSTLLDTAVSYCARRIRHWIEQLRSGLKVNAYLVVMSDGVYASVSGLEDNGAHVPDYVWPVVPLSATLPVLAHAGLDADEIDTVRSWVETHGGTNVRLKLDLDALADYELPPLA